MFYSVNILWPKLLGKVKKEPEKKEPEKKKKKKQRMCVPDHGEREWMGDVFSQPMAAFLSFGQVEHGSYAICKSDEAHIFEIPDILFILLQPFVIEEEPG